MTSYDNKELRMDKPLEGYTEEPWTVLQPPGTDPPFYVMDSDNVPLAIFSASVGVPEWKAKKRPAEANARRAVETVNACRGVEHLEEGSVKWLLDAAGDVMRWLDNSGHSSIVRMTSLRTYILMMRGEAKDGS